MNKSSVWTIGHSTRSIEVFLSMLASFDIRNLADVRTYPGSRRYPHFNQENFSVALENAGIKYFHFPDLGGRRKPSPDSINTAWRNTAFRGYADHMQTPAFEKAITDLQLLASQRATAYMCSEAVWWSCHRALISDFLKAEGWQVFHIMDINKASEHPYTSAAKVKQGMLFYGGE
jgi:uncharacterized protein (DUF488 family)